MDGFASGDMTVRTVVGGRGCGLLRGESPKAKAKLLRTGGEGCKGQCPNLWSRDSCSPLLLAPRRERIPWGSRWRGGGDRLSPLVLYKIKLSQPRESWPPAPALRGGAPPNPPVKRGLLLPQIREAWAGSPGRGPGRGWGRRRGVSGCVRGAEG